LPSLPPETPPAHGGDALHRAVRTYEDIDRLLLSRVRDDPRPYPARAAIAGRAVCALLGRLGGPQRRLRFLHVAGSKGKGSVALMAEHLLLGCGEPVGTYLSPHLRRWNERVRVAGAPVADAALASALETLRPHLAALDALGEALAPSFFDVITAAALLAFARAGCRTVVLETGLGGRYDATNVVTPAACCITSIELEHTDKLGSTLADIAWHKAGIVKAGAPVVTGALPPAARAVVQRRVAEVGSRELRLGRDWHLASEPGPEPLWRRVRYREEAAAGGFAAQFRIRHPSSHMAVNAGLAVALVRAAGWQPDPARLEGCALPARAEVLRERPWIVVDGAHTTASLAALAQSLDRIPAASRRFVVSAGRGKALPALAALLEGAAQVVVTRADPLRSAPADEVAAGLAALRPALPLEVVAAPRAALARALEGLPGDALLCVCGSVYLAGLALEGFEA